MVASQICILPPLGAIQEAVELVNDVDPEILDTNPKLFFHLQQQQLLELIKQVMAIFAVHQPVLLDLCCIVHFSTG